MSKSQNAVQLFNHEQFGEIRAVMIDGVPYFVGKDVAAALGYTNPRKAIRDHVRDKHKRGERIVTPSGIQETTLVSEPGLYGLVMSSKLPAAENFQDWVYEEVLPLIRKTGEYKIGDEEPKAPLRISDVAQDVVSAAKIFEEYLGLKQGIAFVHSVALAESNYNINLDPIKKLAPPAEHNTGYLNATQLAEKVGRTARQANKWLADNGYQFREGRNWRLTEKGKQYAEEFPYTKNGHSGYQIRWNEPAVQLLLEEFVH